MRDWAEKAYWFQPLSAPAGERAIKVLAASQNLDVSSRAGDGGMITGYTSHTYLTGRPLPVMWDVFRGLAGICAGTTASLGGQ